MARPGAHGAALRADLDAQRLVNVQPREDVQVARELSRSGTCWRGSTRSAALLLLGHALPSPIDFSDQQLEERDAHAGPALRLLGEAAAPTADGAPDEAAAAAVAGLDARFARRWTTTSTPPARSARSSRRPAPSPVRWPATAGSSARRSPASSSRCAASGRSSASSRASPPAWAERLRALERAGSGAAVDPAWVESKIAERAAARAARDFAAADRVRTELLERASPRGRPRGDVVAPEEDLAETPSYPLSKRGMKGGFVPWNLAL